MQGGTALANIQLAKNLLQLRQEHHYTQKQLGDKLNITHQAYSYYETGHRDPNMICSQSFLLFMDFRLNSF